ncbi:hypothetical protein LTR85_005740 [Meristemomyces frigidus]|nr:hypothetical protein LTR85_005740 [Meristemomyces frigidus]
MSEVQNSFVPVEATEPNVAATNEVPETTAAETAAPIESAAPAVDGAANERSEPAAAAVSVEESKVETTPSAEKTIEPITEGQLAYKGPGLIKSLVPSKKEFWLSDAPVTPQHMDLYMRGEKPEISHAVVAWASETGKGLLFFNKKGETDQTRPHSVLPLYEATDLRKVSPHEISFEINGHKHTLKAANDAERDGWYISLERAIEMGKADKEAIRASEGYKAEMEKLNKPNTIAGGVAGAGAGAGAGAAAAAVRSKSQAKKSTDVDRATEPTRTGSDADEDVEKKHKSRSTSRGIINKLKGKKDDVETKREEKKEEKATEKEEKKEEKEEAKVEKTGEVAPLDGVAALDAPSTADRVMAAPVEGAQEPIAASEPVTDVPAAKPDEKVARPGKRGSIFGRVSSGWGSLKSPVKEKELKDAELKPDVPPKDAGVSETAPQIPEPTTEIATDATAPPAIETTEPESESKPAEAAKEQLDAISPNSQPKSFLSGLPFLNKRGRSVSPSAAKKEAPVKQEEIPAVPAKDETAVEPAAAATEDPINPVTEPTAATEPLDKPVEQTEEPAKTEATSPTANKRQSVFGNLGRRASKAFKGYQSPKKENVAPATTEPKTEEATETAPAVADADKPTINGESKALETEQQPSSIGDVVPDAVEAGQPLHSTPTVTASA